MFSRKLSFITPEFTPVQELVPGIERQARLQPEVTVTNPTWSGTVVHAPPGQAFGWVTGEWNVPDVMPVAGQRGNWVSLAWIGIDGNTDVTQIGTLQSVTNIFAPGSTTSLENQVEWVLERPFVGGAQAQLPNFGEVYFDSAVGGEGLENVVQAGQDTVINMTENGNVVATTTVETPTLIKIAYTGS